MFIVKMIKYQKSGENEPARVEQESIREAKSIHVLYIEDGRKVVQLDSAPGSNTVVATVGQVDSEFSLIQIMNEHGQIVETLR